MKLATREQLGQIGGLMNQLTYYEAQAIIERRRQIGFEHARREWLAQALSYAVNSKPWSYLPSIVEIVKMTKDQGVAWQAIRTYTGPAIDKIKPLLMLGTFFGSSLGLSEARRVVSAGKLNCQQPDTYERAVALALIAKASGEKDDVDLARQAASENNNAGLWASIASFTKDQADFEKALRALGDKTSGGRRLQWQADIARAYVVAGDYGRARKMANAIGRYSVQDCVDILVEIAEKTRNSDDAKAALEVLNGQFGNQDQSGFEHRCRLVCITRDPQALDTLCTQVECSSATGLYRAVYQVAVAKAISEVYGL